MRNKCHRPRRWIGDLGGTNPQPILQESKHDIVMNKHFIIGAAGPQSSSAQEIFREYSLTPRPALAAASPIERGSYRLIVARFDRNDQGPIATGRRQRLQGAIDLAASHFADRYSQTDRAAIPRYGRRFIH